MQRAIRPVFCTLTALCLWTNELSAYVLVQAPDDLVFAVLSWPVAGEQKLKFIGNGDSKGADPHASARNIGNEAIGRWPFPSWIFARRSSG
jgi:hypothetical protein